MRRVALKVNTGMGDAEVTKDQECGAKQNSWELLSTGRQGDPAGFMLLSE